MDNDPCATGVGWSVLGSAPYNLTLAGVLAGFLIAVVAALLVQWYDRSSPRMIALFASGVPALTLSSYLFSISTGAIPSRDHCNQVWSQWLPAFAALLIGGSVLLCGLGWALVIYSDNLANKLIEKKFSAKRIEDYRRFFIGLNAWLSLAATTGTTGLLIAANVIYLKATTDRKRPLILFELRGVKWYAMFFVYLFGVYVIVRSAYLVIRRATSVARREHVPGVDTKSLTLRGAWDNKRVRRVVEEFGITVALVLGALLASHWTTKALKTEPVSGRNIRDIVVAVVVAYTIGRLAYCVIVPRYAAKVRVRPSTEEPEDAIQPKYSGGRLMATSYNVVLFAILPAVFSEWLTQGALPTNLQSGLSLFIGGLYPAGILLGLSYSVPAAPGIRLPEWKTLRGLRLLP